MSLNPIIKNTLDGILSEDKGSSLVAPSPHWRDGPLNHYPQPPVLDGPIGWPKPQPSPGGKWECKYVNEPSNPDWGGGFPRPTPGNI